MLFGKVADTLKSSMGLSMTQTISYHLIGQFYCPMGTVADPGISGGGGDINPAAGLGGAVSPPVGSRGEAPGHQTKCNCTLNLFYYH